MVVLVSRSVLVGLVLAATLAGPKDARADASSAPRPGATSSRTDIAMADQLFAEGKALLGSNLLQACGKFEESLRYNPAAIGTLLNVARCDEKLGRVASAVTKFSEARNRAAEQGLREHVRAAEAHIAKLEPLVPHITIKLTAPVPDTKVLIDDRVIPLDTLDRIAIDPGERVVVVSAPARLPHRVKLVIGNAEHQDIVVPQLARSVVVTSSRRLIGQITTGAGGATLLAGVIVGLSARSLYHEQFGHREPGDGLCDDMNRCEAPGQSRTQRARTLGNVGTAVGAVGIALAAVGVYLWLSAPRASGEPGGSGEPAAERLTIMPVVGSALGPGGLGIAATGRF